MYQAAHVCKAPVREYGKIEVTVDKSSKLFGNVSEKTICWMSHNDYIEKEAPGFKIIATHFRLSGVEPAECEEKNLYAIQFHPEVLHTVEGTKDAVQLRIRMSVAVQATGRWMPL